MLVAGGLLIWALLGGSPADPAEKGQPYYDFLQNSYGRTTTFEERKRAFVEDNGQFFYSDEEPGVIDYPSQALWSWLENGNDAKIDMGIQALVDSWAAGTGDSRGSALRAMFHPAVNPSGLKTRCQDYDNCRRIFERYLEDLEHPERIFVQEANLNQVIQKASVLYLFLQEYPEQDRDVVYDYVDFSGWKDFCYDGRCYRRGETYDWFQLLEDYLQYRYDWYVGDSFSSNEFDVRNYMYTHLRSALMIYDFVAETILRKTTTAERMKTKAKMVIDFLLLDMGMDFSANQWGGVGGFREPASQYVRKRENTGYQCVMLGLGCAFQAGYKPTYDAYLTSYRVPALIQDVVDIDDEPDNYWHEHMEYNENVHRQGKGKLTFVTKFYNLGGGYDYNWLLNIKSDELLNGDPGVHVGMPFRLWTRSVPVRNNVRDYASGEVPGGNFGQYRNALFSPENNQNLHFFTYLNQDDYSARFGSWDFFARQGNRYFMQEGRTMVILELDAGGSFLEVAIQGVDYPDMAAFRRAFVGGNTTSHGEVLSRDPSTGDVIVNGKPVYNYPFKRMETMDNQGRHIIDWQDGVMTVSRHGRTCVYDFRNWRYNGDCGQDDPQPLPCDGDLNEDGTINVLDLQRMVGAILDDNPGGLCADLDGNGRIDVLDLQMLVSRIMAS